MFKNLKSARNSFVHEGLAKIGGKSVTVDEARRLVNGAKDIILYIREKLPEQHKWKIFEYKLEIQITKRIF